MATKEIDIQQNLIITPALEEVAEGYIAFGAKADGLYQKIWGSGEKRLLTEDDMGGGYTETDTLDTVTGRGAATDHPIQVGNISIKDKISIVAGDIINYINSVLPFNIRINGSDKILIDETKVEVYNDVSVKKTFPAFRISSLDGVNSTEKLEFVDDGFVQMEIGSDNIDQDETYINAHKPFSFKYDGVEKMSVDADGVHISDTEMILELDFLDLTAYVFNCPVAMKFTSQTSEGTNATLSTALNTNMALYQKLTITPTQIGLVILKGVKV